MKKSRKKKPSSHLFFLQTRRFWAIGLPVILFIIIFYIFILRDLPSPSKLNSENIPQSSLIYDRHGTLLYTIYAGRNQTLVPLSTIPKYMQDATIAIEDRDFYNHGALDFRGIARAFISTIFQHQTQGGSTLTQQLVKNSLLETNERTITRKIREAILAFATEVVYPKNKILEMYLNQTPYGGTAWGIEAASQSYFGKHAKDLSLAQSTLLAGLPEAPTTFSPFGSHPELAKQRQRLVLQDMLDQNYISRKQFDDALNTPLNYQKVSSNILAPHFVLYVKDLLEKKYGVQTVEQGGLRVTTSLDLNIQNFAQVAVATEVAKLKSAHVTNGAALVTKPGTGEVLAMVGSRNYFDREIDGNVNLTISKNRQPGSSIKPVNYAVGLIHGYTAATPFVDEPVCFSNGNIINSNTPPNSPAPAGYCPHNYDMAWHGLVQMRYSLGNSFNIPAVKMLKANGVESMIATASAMGITTLTSPDKYGLSLTLGGAEVPMIDMATAYAVFANSGYRVDLQPILKVTDRNGKVLESYKPLPSPIFGKKVLSPSVAFIISDVLADNSARVQEFGPASELYIPNQFVSAKTGTTDNFRDNWTIGYTPSILVAVWVGNNDYTPMTSVASGITGAAPIWHDIMTHLLKGKAKEMPQRPSTVIQKNVCSTSGLLPPADGTPNKCPTRFEYFIKGSEPTQVDNSEQKTWIDKTTQDLPKSGQTDNLELKDEIVVTDPVGDRYCVTCNHPSPTPTPGH